MSFTLSSPHIEPNATLSADQVFNDWGCTGNNISPELNWENAPEGTKSFAVTVYDPDAPTGSGFWHWMVINIPAEITSLVAGAGAHNSDLLPEGTFTLRNDYGYRGFGGACPPEGDEPHRYEFTVFALGVDKIELSNDTTTAVGGFNIRANALASATFTATFGR